MDVGSSMDLGYMGGVDTECKSHWTSHKWACVKAGVEDCRTCLGIAVKWFEKHGTESVTGTVKPKKKEFILYTDERREEQEKWLDEKRNALARGKESYDGPPQKRL